MKSRINTGLALASAWIVFAVVHTSMNYIAPAIEAVYADSGQVMAPVFNLTKGMAGMRAPPGCGGRDRLPAVQ